MKRAQFYSGVFLLTFATLMLEILETRLLSVMSWYHLAFFVISAGMFGMTGGAVFVYFRGQRYTPATLASDLKWYTSAFAVSSVLSLAMQVTIAPAMVASAAMAISFVELAIIISIPFFFSGAAVSLALTRSPFSIGKVYAADLMGAALGCLGVLGLLELVDGPSAIILTGAISAAAAMMFGSSAKAPGEERSRIAGGLLMRPGLIVVALAILGIANASTTHGIQPIVVKDKAESRRGEGRYTYEKWNSFSRVVAFQSRGGFPGLWGPSPTLPKDLDVQQIWLNIDGLAGTAMYPYKGGADEAQFLKWDVPNLVYRIRNTGARAAIIGVGGGRDILSAWIHGVRDVTGVELNPTFIRLLTRHPYFSEYAGLARLPGVHLHVDEARSWFARTSERFDTIEMSMIDTFAASGAGAFTLSENGLYTLEGWKTFMGRLTPTGMFTVSRWYAPDNLNETGRAVSLATASLLELGVTEPRKHMFMASTGHIATIIVSRAPFTAEELRTLTDACNEAQYKILMSPEMLPNSDLLAGIVSVRSAGELQARTSGLDLDLTPPTDNRPFFFNMLPLTKAHHAFKFLGRNGLLAGNIFATLVLVGILLITVTLVSVTILVPAARSVGEVGRSLIVGGTSYFSLIGLGFMLVEIALLQRMSVYLGHPVWSLSVVLFSLILTTGMGSWISDRLQAENKTAVMIWILSLFAYLSFMAFGMPGILERFDASRMVTRALVVFALITPSGLLMGFGFPIGMRLVEARDSRPTPWFWGVNGAAGVLASTLAIAISLSFGIRVTFLVGAACYLALIPAIAMLRSTPLSKVPSVRATS